jgi:uncharacterized protein (DUF983 family)
MTNQRCPGNELNKSLTTYSCECPSCGTSNEIFGDEMKKSHKCVECGTVLDLSKCKTDGK